MLYSFFMPAAKMKDRLATKYVYFFSFNLVCLCVLSTPANLLHKKKRQPYLHRNFETRSFSTFLSSVLFKEVGL